MANNIEINVGEMAVGAKDASIRTSGIGSCMVICLYDSVTKTGGMIHSMLPSRKKDSGAVVDADYSACAPAKYVDEGIERLVSEIMRAGGLKGRLIAKLVGGSSMFRFARDESTGIGTKNLEMAKQKLAELEIPIDGEETGGKIGRMAEFNLENGILSVSIKF